jgi:hypothetical protein
MGQGVGQPPVVKGHDCTMSGAQPFGHASGHAPLAGHSILSPQEQQ